MSSFSGLNTALSSLIAQRQALDTVGQNLANVNTPGYTRQRAALVSIDGTNAATGIQSARHMSGGVRVLTVDRLGDMFLENRLREGTSTASRLSTAAAALTRMETGLNEPGDKGLASKLDKFYTSWQDVANRTHDDTARSVLLEDASTLVTQIRDSYTHVRTQWNTMREQAQARVTEVNTLANTVADLNQRIRSLTVDGAIPNDLVDHRARVLTQLSGLVGSDIRYRDDGTVDVLVDGRALVNGNKTAELTVQGAHAFSQATGAQPATPGPTEGPVRLAWADTGRTASVGGGQLAGMLDTLSPDGPYVSLAHTYDQVATEMATSVNALHTTGVTVDGTAGTDFFSFDPANPGGSPALSLQVAITDVAHIAAADPAAGGAFDGSIADKISQLRDSRDTWSRAVVNIGVQTASSLSRTSSAETVRASAESQVISATGVDTDEETLSLLTYSRAYQAASRLVTTIDEMLDTLINRTGIVGR